MFFVFEGEDEDEAEEETLLAPPLPPPHRRLPLRSAPAAVPVQEGERCRIPESGTYTWLRQPLHTRHSSDLRLQYRYTSVTASRAFTPLLLYHGYSSDLPY